jgi:hypothetical protein
MAETRHMERDMEAQAIPGCHPQDAILAMLVASVFLLVSSLVREPNRQHLMAMLMAGAGAAYLNGGIGVWALACTAVATCCASQGLQSESFIGLGWMLPTVWGVIYHVYGNANLPCIPTSSTQCAMTETFIALWLFAPAPSVCDDVQHRGSEKGKAYEDPADHDRP